MYKAKLVILCISLFFSCASFAYSQNTEIQSFSTAKRALESIYFSMEAPKTIYCEASFDDDKNIKLSNGFTTEKHVKRAQKVEWEHIVPAENFGRTFAAWRNGDSQCVDAKGKAYKGRRCAEKVSEEYRYMQADMYNLYPAIGAVNASRSNYNFTMLPTAQIDFGDCRMKIEDRKVEPPENARGKIARVYLYMEATYSRYKMSSSQRQLMKVWNKQYPVSDEECIRAKQIQAIQGNINIILDPLCLEKEQRKVQYTLSQEKN